MHLILTAENLATLGLNLYKKKLHGLKSLVEKNKGEIKVCLRSYSIQFYFQLITKIKSLYKNLSIRKLIKNLVCGLNMRSYNNRVNCFTYFSFTSQAEICPIKNRQSGERPVWLILWIIILN